MSINHCLTFSAAASLLASQSHRYRYKYITKS